MSDSTSPKRRKRRSSVNNEPKNKKIEIVFDFSRTMSSEKADSPAKLSDRADFGRENRSDKPIVFTFDDLHE